jgi:hypothetical protein
LYLIRNRTYLHSTASWLLQVESRQGHSFLAPMDLFGRPNRGWGMGDGGLGLGHKLNLDESLDASREGVDRRNTDKYQLNKFYTNAGHAVHNSVTEPFY